MTGYMDELSERNETVDGKLFAEIGSNDSRALVSENPTEIEGKMYRMVVTQEGVMAIESPNKNARGPNQLKDAIRERINDAANGRNFGAGGLSRNPAFDSTSLEISGITRITVGQGRSMSHNDVFNDVRLIDEPSPEMVATMVVSNKSRFQELAEEKKQRIANRESSAEELEQF